MFYQSNLWGTCPHPFYSNTSLSWLVSRIKAFQRIFCGCTDALNNLNVFCNFIGHVIFGPLYNAAGGHIGIGLLFTARIIPAIKLASTYPTQQIVDAKPLEFFFLVVHSFIGNAVYICFLPTQP